MKKLVTVMAFVCGLAVIGNASAEELGDRNTIAVSGTGLVQVATAPNGASSAVTTVTPRLSWFLTDGVAISIGARYSHMRFEFDPPQEQTVDRIGGELRIGGLVDLSEHVSLWPQIGVHVDSLKSNLRGVAYLGGPIGTPSPYSLDNDGVDYGVSAEIPVVLKLTKHMFTTLSFVTAGWEKQKPSGGPSSHAASFGINPGFGFGIGGWF